MQSQEPEKVDRANQVLTWVIHATRHLKVQELQCALSIEPGSKTLDREAIPDWLSLVSRCMGLVAVDPESLVVRLVHYTAQEYFENRRMELFPDGHTQIAKACMTILSFNEIASFYFKELSSGWNLDGLKRLFRLYPLVFYAAENCERHISQAPEANLQLELLEILGRLEETSYDLIVNCIPSFIPWFEWWMPGLTTDFDPDDLKIDSSKLVGTRQRDGLYGQSGAIGMILAVRWNLKGVVATILDQGGDPNTEDEEGRSALQWALKKGEPTMVKLLLEHNADATKNNGLGRSAFFYAALSESKVTEDVRSMLMLLIDKLAGSAISINSQDDNGQTPLHCVVENKKQGYGQVVNLLLEHGANPNIVDYIGQYPLTLAAQKEPHSKEYEGKVIDSLLINGAEPNQQDRRGRTALHHVASYGLIQAIKLLKRYRAGPDFTDEDGATPLHLAASNGQEEAAELLLQQGADPDAVDYNERTALVRAIEANGGRTVGVAKLLLRYSKKSLWNRAGWPVIQTSPIPGFEQHYLV